MASTFTVNLNLEEPGNGDYPNTWNIPLNSDLTIVDQAMGTSTPITMTSSNVTLTTAQSAFYLFVISGVLTASVQLIFPATIGGSKRIINNTTGAFSITALNGAGDSGGGVVIPQGGTPTSIILTAGRAYLDVYAATPPGTLLDFAGSTAPPGFLLTFGQAVSRTTFAQLFAAIGTVWGIGDGSTTFNLPDFRGRIAAGADNMGGTPAGNLSGYVVGSVGGLQTELLTVAQMPAHSHTDSGHVHTITDPGHTHAPSTAGNFMVQLPPGGQGTLTNGSNPNVEPTTGATASSTTGISVNSGTANLTNTGGGASHPNVQPTAAVNKIIRY
jgi:microcystin-dependent protein